MCEEGGGCICGTLQYKHEVCSNTEISPKELKTICCYSNHSNFAQPLMYTSCLKKEKRNPELKPQHELEATAATVIVEDSL